MPDHWKPLVFNADDMQRGNHFTVSVTGALNFEDLSVVSVSIPPNNLDMMELPYGNTKYKIPTGTTLDDVTIVFRDMESPDIAKILSDWIQKVRNRTTGAVDNYGEENMYMSDIHVEELQPDGSSRSAWDYLYCFPTSIDWGEYNAESSEVKQITVTFAVNQVDKVS